MIWVLDLAQWDCWLAKAIKAILGKHCYISSFLGVVETPRKNQSSNNG